MNDQLLHGQLAKHIPYIAVLLLVAVFYYIFTWQTQLAGFMADDAVYLILADYFTAREGVPYDVGAHVLNAYPYPPLYPVILGLLGGGSADIGMAHVITTTFLLATAVLLYLWASAESGSRLAGLLLSLVFLLMPGTLFHALETWSEFSYLFFSIAACYLVYRARDNTQRWYLAALCVACASLTREIGLSLLLAFILTVWLRRVPGRIILGLLAIVPVLVWKLYVAFSLQARGDYSSGFDYLAGLDPARIADVVQGNLLRLYAAWNGLFTVAKPGDLQQIGSALLLLLFLPVFILFLKRARMDAIYLLLYLGVVIIWPYQDHYARFLLGIAPLVLFYASIGVVEVTGKLAWPRLRRLSPFVALIVVVSMSAPSLAHISGRFLSPVPPGIEGLEKTRYWLRATSSDQALHDLTFRQALIASMHRLEGLLAPDDCVYSAFPEIVMLYGRRISLLPPAESLTDEEFFVQASRCDYYYLIATPTRTYQSPLYPLVRLQSRDYELVSSDRTEAGVVALLVRLNRR